MSLIGTPKTIRQSGIDEKGIKPTKKYFIMI